MANQEARYTILSNGEKMPLVGLGTLQSDPEQLVSAIKSAVECGYRLIDTAWVYGNEEVVGRALKEVFAEGKVHREDMFITTKLHVQFLHKEDVVPSLKDSLGKLGLDYVDLYLIHAPIGIQKDPNAIFPLNPDGSVKFDVVDPLETWKGMEDCHRLGLAKSIGLSNFNSKQIQRIHDAASVKPMNLQVVCNVHFRQEQLFNFVRKLGMTMTAYSPLGSPAMADNKLLPEEMKKNLAVKQNLLDDEIVAKIAKNHGKSVAQVCLRYCVQRGIAVIPKSVNPGRIQANFDIWDFCLTPEEMQTLNDHPITERAAVADNMKDHPHYPFSEPF